MTSVSPARVPFTDPPWDAPLDADQLLATIPKNAEVAGVFTEPVAQALRELGSGDRVPRARYLSGKSYPLIEHACLLVDLASLSSPDLRQGLRRIGRAAQRVFLTCTAGRVTVGSQQDPEAVLRATAQAYGFTHSPGHAELLHYADGEATIAVRQIYTFLDCHHVGAWERALSSLGLKATVQIASYSHVDADLRLTW